MQGAGVREEFDLEVLRSVSLGFGQSSDDEDDKHKKMAWTFLGFVSLVDPPRDSVPDMIQICREASIQVVMATGDHPLIAKSNARRIGLLGVTLGLSLSAAVWKSQEEILTSSRTDRSFKPTRITNGLACKRDIQKWKLFVFSHQR